MNTIARYCCRRGTLASLPTSTVVLAAQRANMSGDLSHILANDKERLNLVNEPCVPSGAKYEVPLILRFNLASDVVELNH